MGGGAPIIGEPRRAFAEDDDVGLGFPQPGFHAVAQRGDVAGPRKVILREHGSRAEADDAGRVLGPAAQAPLLPAAVDERRDIEP